MEFWYTVVDFLRIAVIGIGAVFMVPGVMNFFEGYGNDNPGAKSQGWKQVGSGVGIILLGIFVVPALKDVFNV